MKVQLKCQLLRRETPYHLYIPSTAHKPFQTLHNPSVLQTLGHSVEDPASPSHEDAQPARNGISVASAPVDEDQSKNNGLNNPHNITVNRSIGQAVI